MANARGDTATAVVRRHEHLTPRWNVISGVPRYAPGASLGDSGDDASAMPTTTD